MGHPRYAKNLHATARSRASQAKKDPRGRATLTTTPTSPQIHAQDPSILMPRSLSRVGFHGAHEAQVKSSSRLDPLAACPEKGNRQLQSCHYACGEVSCFSHSFFHFQTCSVFPIYRRFFDRKYRKHASSHAKRRPCWCSCREEDEGGAIPRERGFAIRRHSRASVRTWSGQGQASMVWHLR